MINQTILIIRHADKPDGNNTGVDETGAEDSRSLIPRGWQRSGIWAELFAPSLGQGPSLPMPGTLFASAPAAKHEDDESGASKSKRPLETVSLLAAKLGIQVNLTYSKGDERALAEELAKTAGVALVCWQHENIADITLALAPGVADVPTGWPSDRFNVVLQFDRTQQNVNWSCKQIVPWMLDGDSKANI